MEPSPDPLLPEEPWRAQARKLTRQFAEVRRHIKRRLGILAPLHIAMYDGYGTTTRLILRGRVLEERQRAAPSQTDSPFANFRRAFWQLESDEVPNVALELTWGPAPGALASSESASVITDEDGYFVIEQPLATPVAPGWLRVHARVVRAPYPVQALPSAEGQALVPSPEARFGVISDIDDTILQSFVQDRPRMVYLTLVGNPFTRLSFEGTTELYRGLRQGGRGAPFFYVSKSMWNLYPLLERFIAHQRLPRGPLLLRRVGLFASRRNAAHKAQAVHELLATYPTLPFILIGDSGERDLPIYLDAARAHPGRVPVILIRNVSPLRHAGLGRAPDADVPAGCRVLVFDDTQRAIELCAELGFWQRAPLESQPPPPDVAPSP